MKSLLQKLTETFAPSGYEAAIREVIRAEIEPLADEIRVDALGNLIARKGKGGKRIMVAAHMDEIGLIASHIDENGFVRFTTIGGVYPQMLMGARVRFYSGVPGIVYTEPLDKPTDTPAIEKMFIDVGATSRADCPVKVGEVAAFERPFLDLGDRLVAKSMDDRIGCLVAIEALRALKDTPNEVYFVFTTQEEVGTRGAETSAFGIDPDLGFSLDVTSWGDTPGRKHFEMALGKGPAIKIKDGGMLSDPRIIRWMVNTAEAQGIPYQREVLLGGTTDARAMQLVRAGVPVGCISIPCRYVHSPSEMVDYNDVQNAVKLTTALLANPVEW
ncbi:MAG: M42 family metallopeptidase [Anaerolineales bacterium]|nr:M42 family metallopeptidase [Anaerolineales bacterium]MDW8276942.1 M42 family metallopeptidase [Anaerolineales bacterium]